MFQKHSLSEAIQHLTEATWLFQPFRVVCLIDLWKLEIVFNCKFIEFRATCFVPTRAVIKLKLVEIVNIKD